MKSLVSYLSRMKERNEGAAKLLQVASAFTHVAGTFLKNYGKIEQQREHAGKRRRREVDSGDDDAGTLSKPQEMWPRERGGTREKTSFGGLPDDSYATTAFPRDHFERVLLVAAPVSVHTPTHDFAPPVSVASTISMEEDGFGEVDLHPASFLRWPDHDGQGLPMDMGIDVSNVGSGAPAFDMDLQALMAQPEGFQMQMEQAVLRGPLEFDWLSWEGST